ncbi:outer membrane protein transport protein [Vibrio gigantis]|uniref:OmpP1/FadL family transporter n=1 Tax=Vibrio gigantis TaxID=296199 RepID=UPI002FCC7214
MKKTTFIPFLVPLLCAPAFAGGIILPEVATFDSVSSAGVANTVNRNDASAAITNPAGLSAIEDYSYSLGLQYVDAYSAHEGQFGIGPVFNAHGENKAVAPSLAYAQRINDQWVVGASLHAEGGLGMDYTNGLIGGNLVDSMSIELANLHLAASYQISPQLTLGGAIVVQHLIMSAGAFDSILDGVQVNGISDEDSSTKASFILSAMYDINASTYLGFNYKHKVDHDITLTALNRSADLMVTWPSSVEVGIHHQINDLFAAKALVGYEAWSQYGDASGHKAEDVYSIGAALEYTEGSWTYQSGLRYDSEMVKTSNMTPDLALGSQWAYGLGAEYTRSNGHRVGLAYEYRALGTPDVEYHYPIVGATYQGQVTDNRLQFISFSYAY